MIRIALASISLVLTGCVTSLQGVPHGCEVFEYAGGLHQVEGLIFLPDDLRSELKQLLPEDAGDDMVCWYVSGDDFVLANTRYENTSIYGYRFSKDGKGNWSVDEHPYILALPNR